MEELNELGLYFVENERTVMKTNIHFRKNEKLIVPFQRSLREPKLFTFFPESKEDIITYCNNKIKSGELSTESLCCEIKNVIIPRCYAKLLLEAGEANRNSIPNLPDLLLMLDIRTLGLQTVWRWLHYLGFQYDENKRSYYTDGHD